MGEWAYVRCGLCGIARLDPMPEPAELAAVFDDGYFAGGGARGGYQDYDADAPTHRLNAVHRLARLPAAAAPAGADGPGGPGVLIDVGCASGYTLEVAAEHGWPTAGVEISPSAAAAARAGGHRVATSLSDLVDGSDGGEPLAGRAGAVCFFQVLEHLADPHAELVAARALLRPGGVVICETWDGASAVARLSGSRWQQLSPPSVLWILDRASTRALTARAGLRMTTWRATSKRVSLALVVGQLAPVLPRPLSGPMHAVARRIPRLQLPYAMGDLVTFTATFMP